MRLDGDFFFLAVVCGVRKEGCEHQKRKRQHKAKGIWKRPEKGQLRRSRRRKRNYGGGLYFAAHMPNY